MNQEYKLKGKTYKCMDLIKLRRAVFGLDDGSRTVPGVGENAKSEVILGEYDRLGGYITNKGGYKVLNGGIADYRASKAAKSLVLKKEPEILLEVRVNGVTYEIEEGADLPLEVQLAQKKPEKGEKKVRIKKEVKEEVKEEVEEDL